MEEDSKWLIKIKRNRSYKSEYKRNRNCKIELLKIVGQNRRQNWNYKSESKKIRRCRQSRRRIKVIKINAVKQKRRGVEMINQNKKRIEVIKQNQSCKEES